MGSKGYKIGDLARLSGVPIKTIRHYSDVGVLPPAATTKAGFRLYRDEDRARLELIRSLREAGFSLVTIGGLLGEETTVPSALDMQLEVLEDNLRRLKRRRTLIKAALDQSELGASAYLKCARALIDLDAVGREQFLDRHLGHALKEVDGPPGWKAKLWKEGVLDFPEEIDGDQFKAWLELAELMLDTSYKQHLNEMLKRYWQILSENDDGNDLEEWRKSQDELFTHALEVAQQGEVPQCPQGQTLVQRYIEVNAAFLNRNADLSFPHELLFMREKLLDRRVQRYWELVGILKGQTPQYMWSKYQAHSWLVEGLKWRVTNLHKAGSLHHLPVE